MIPQSARENFERLLSSPCTRGPCGTGASPDEIPASPISNFQFPISNSSAFALAVSGHCDSTALLRLFLDLCPNAPKPHVIHLDHQLRGEASAADAEFVRSLCLQFNLPHTFATRADMEALDIPQLPNPSARWRLYRQTLFKQVVEKHHLAGVLLAHHADDQAETVLQRLLRKSTLMGLTGMDFHAKIHGVSFFRPLLSTTKKQLQDYLRSIDQPWREDASNASPKYQRNRVRVFLGENPDWVPDLLELADACRHLAQSVRQSAPTLASEFPISKLADLPELLARESARKWLIAKGAPPDELIPKVLDRLIQMAADAATPHKQDFPGQISVRRKKGIIL